MAISIFRIFSGHFLKSQNIFSELVYSIKLLMHEMRTPRIPNGVHNREVPIYFVLIIRFLYCIDRVQCYLLYPHSWVRLVSSRLVGLLFGSSDIDEITTALLPSNNDTSNGTLKKKKVWLRFFVNGGLSKVIKCLLIQ